MGEGGGRTAKMLKKIDEANATKPAESKESKSSVFIWPSGGAHGERTGDEYDGSFSGTRAAKKKMDKKYPRDKEL